MSAFKQSMRKLGIRAGLLTGASLAVVAIAGAGASSASAACTGEIAGQGSSLQKIAQTEIWTSGYTAGGCAGGNAEPKYTSSSSGTGLAAWGYTGGAIERTWKYIGTDDGPNSTQIGNAKTAAGAGSHTVTVPVAQTAIAILIHPPTGCTLNSITNVHLEEAFSGAAESWSAIGAVKTGTTEACPGTKNLTRVVRKDASGTTYQFKNYLSLINKLRHSGTEEPACAGQKKWTELEEVPTKNLEWPQCGSISQVTPAGTGGGEVVAKVVATEGAIGYAALPDSKKNASSVTTNVQNNGISGSPIFKAPGTGTEEANCASAEYTVPAAGNKTLSGSGIDVDWSQVFGGQPSIGGTTYPICTLTYDLGWENYVTSGFAAGVGTSVKKFYEYIITNGTGTGTVKKWYSNVPAKTSVTEEHNVEAAAKFAIEKITAN